VVELLQTDSEFARFKILEALTYEPYLTTNQVAKLFYRVRRDGTEAKPQVAIRKATGDVLKAPGYDSAKDMLKAMRNRGEIKVHKLPKEKIERTRLYSLPGRKTPSPSNWQHEMTCAWLFVEYELTGGLTDWDDRWTADQFQGLSGQFGKKVFNYDRRMEHKQIPNVVFWEVDKGTEIRDTLANKIQNYVRLQHVTHDRFTVVFTVAGSKWANAKNRIRFLLEEFAHARKANMFVVGLESEILAAPLGDVVYSPLTGLERRVSLTNL
jgi:hypothetical protein